MGKSLVSLERGLDILCAFTSGERDLSAQAIASRLNLPLSTTYRYLDILLERKILSRDQKTKLYSLGMTVFRLGQIVLSQIEIADIAEPHMEHLCREARETVFLTVVHEWESVCVKTVQARRLISLTIDEGTHQALHIGASSRVLLAYQNEDFFREYVKRSGLTALTKNSFCDEQALADELTTTRERGYTISYGESDQGARAVAAPVFDHFNRLAAGLSIAGPDERFTEETLPELIRLVTMAAARISKGLGYEPKSPGEEMTTVAQGGQP